MDYCRHESIPRARRFVQPDECSVAAPPFCSAIPVSPPGSPDLSIRRLTTKDVNIRARRRGCARPIAGTILQRIALVALAAPKRIIAAAAVMMAVCGIFGLPVTKALSTGDSLIRHRNRFGQQTS